MKAAAGVLERRRVLKSPDVAIIQQRTLPAMYIIDSGLRLLASYVTDEHGRERRQSLVLRPENGALPQAIAATVRSLLEQRNKAQRLVGVAEGGLVVRVVSLESFSGVQTLAVFVEPHKVREHVKSAVKQFSLTKRESEVLTLLIAGARSKDIAEKLVVAETTAIFHVKRLLGKTSSRNRVELMSKVFG